MATNDLQVTLDRILSELKSNDPSRCLGAIQELGTLNASSEAILLQLEHLTLQADSEVQAAALNALSWKTHQFVASKRSTLDQAQRKVLLAEIENWLKAELIGLHRAEVLRRRYDFDIKPAAKVMSQSAAVAQEQVEQAATPKPVVEQTSVPAVPRASLMQTLLSESSIKVYLYLGAFFVIASALILAAVVEAARLPILAVATLAFGGGAFVIRRRLPQPSFALFIVFSFLLPIDANVLEETIGFTEPALSIYWTFIFLVMAAIWGLSIWFYESSFFSAVAFIALSLGFYRAAQIFQTEFELTILLGMLASLVALPGSYFLKKWKADRFAMPVVLLAQLQVIVLLAASLILSAVHMFDSEIPSGWWLIIALTWLFAASFFAASDILFPFVLFPWMAVAALLPVPWFVLQTFNSTEPAYAVGFWIWAAVLALLSEAFLRLHFERIRKYHWALIASSIPLFFTSIVIALVWEQPALTFALLAGIALVYTALHILRPRWYVWSAALLSAVAAYAVFFTLPSVEGLEIPIVYQVLGASLLLTVPQLFLRTPLTIHNQTRLPAIVFGLLVSVFTAALALSETQRPGGPAVVFLLFAILLTLHAFHFKRPWIGYFAAAAETLAILYGLQYFELSSWLPVLVTLSVLYYATGFLLRRTNSEFKDWGTILINSGLGLGLLLCFSALGLAEEAAGWYMIVIALLFAVEVFARPLAWLEVIVEGLLSLSLFMILNDSFVSNPIAHFLFGASLIWLGGDLLFGLLIEKRAYRPITLGVGYLLLVGSTVNLLSLVSTPTATIYLAAYALFFALYAFVRREPLLGYFVTGYIPLATIKLWDVVNLEKWIFPLILLAMIYYALGFALRRTEQARGWDRMLLNSGLGLGVLTSIAAPIQGGLDASIPVAIAATLFAVEAFRQRNVWWALPANALYLMSYFMILWELNVEQPQYYSIGAALLGMLMHFLLTRAGSRTGAFIAGMLSQLVLLGTTYIQMVSANELGFFFVLFVQSLVILAYGLILRSRSLVITPIVFAVLGVATVVYSALKGLSTVILVGCTGVVLLLLGIVAVVLRERITKFGEQLSDWRP
jgi:hypothetical protein